MTDPAFDCDKVAPLIRLALAEDLGAGDVTSEAVASPAMTARMTFVARQRAVVAGLVLLQPLFHEVSPQVTVELAAADGDRVSPDQVLARAEGPARALLTAERLALNFLQRLSGIATLTRAFVDAVADSHAAVFDTRKTTPGLRLLEKYAVRVGGGHNHRIGLYDQILIKDNHLKCLALQPGPNPLAALVARIRSRHPGMIIEVEVEHLDALDRVLDASVDVILLDNMTPAQLAHAVRRARSRPNPPLLECSGSVTLESVASLAATGVDRISVGRITHSAPAVDMAADLDHVQEPRPES